MDTLQQQATQDFLRARAAFFNKSRIAKLRRLTLDELLEGMNPYLYFFRGKDLSSVSEMLHRLLDDFMATLEKELLDGFLRSLALFVSEQARDARTSSIAGVDLEFDSDGARYIVAIKSSRNDDTTEQGLRAAIATYRQLHPDLCIRPVLGVCHGRPSVRDNGLYMEMFGQSFWYFLSGDENLYIDVIQMIKLIARPYDQDVDNLSIQTSHRLFMEFAARFCTPDYFIDWPKLVAFNSGNLQV